MEKMVGRIKLGSATWRRASQKAGCVSGSCVERKNDKSRVTTWNSADRLKAIWKSWLAAQRQQPAHGPHIRDFRKEDIRQRKRWAKRSCVGVVPEDGLGLPADTIEYGVAGDSGLGFEFLHGL